MSGLAVPSHLLLLAPSTCWCAECHGGEERRPLELSDDKQGQERNVTLG